MVRAIKCRSIRISDHRQLLGMGGEFRDGRVAWCFKDAVSLPLSTNNRTIQITITGIIPIIPPRRTRVYTGLHTTSVRTCCFIVAVNDLVFCLLEVNLVGPNLFELDQKCPIDFAHLVECHSSGSILLSNQYASSFSVPSISAGSRFSKVNLSLRSS